MCPDRQILSLYIDNELPSPWKEKLETHIASCESCRLRLGEYGKIRGFLAASSGAAMEAAKERVWVRLASETRNGAEDGTDAPAFSVVRAERKSGSRRTLRRTSRRTINLPVPAAAAAAAVFIITALFAVRGFQTPAPAGAGEASVARIGTDLQGIVPVSDMDSVFQYLSGQDMGDSVIIQLPDSQNFSSYGEPALLRAADYSGSDSRRRAVSP